MALAVVRAVSAARPIGTRASANDLVGRGERRAMRGRDGEAGEREQQHPQARRPCDAPRAEPPASEPMAMIEPSSP